MLLNQGKNQNESNIILQNEICELGKWHLENSQFTFICIVLHVLNYVVTLNNNITSLLWLKNESLV